MIPQTLGPTHTKTQDTLSASDPRQPLSGDSRGGFCPRVCHCPFQRLARSIQAFSAINSSIFCTAGRGASREDGDRSHGKLLGIIKVVARRWLERRTRHLWWRGGWPLLLLHHHLPVLLLLLHLPPLLLLLHLPVILLVGNTFNLRVSLPNCRRILRISPCATPNERHRAYLIRLDTPATHTPSWSDTLRGGAPALLNPFLLKEPQTLNSNCEALP